MTTKELLQQALDALLPHSSSHGNSWRSVEDAAIKAIEQALAQQEQPAQEAVAYELEAVKFANGKKLVYQKPENLASYIKVRTLVYADADPAPTQPALSESQITSIAYNCNALPEVITDKTLVDFVRAIEAHCRGGADK